MSTLRTLELLVLIPIALCDALLTRLLATPTVTLVQPLAPEPPAAAIQPPSDLSSLPVVQLRTLARARLGSSARIGSREDRPATKAALLQALA